MGPQILNAAQAHRAGTLLNYNGVQVLQTSGKKANWLAILDGRIAIAGDQELVKAALDRRGGSAANSALAPDAASLQNRYDAWVVAAGVFTPPVSDRTPAPPAAALAAIQKTIAGVEFGANIRFTGEAVTRSEKDAQALVDVVRFMASMLQLNRDGNPQFQLIEPVLNAMDLRAEAATVKLSVSIPEADLEQTVQGTPTRPERSVSITTCCAGFRVMASSSPAAWSFERNPRCPAAQSCPSFSPVADSLIGELEAKWERARNRSPDCTASVNSPSRVRCYTMRTDPEVYIAAFYSDPVCLCVRPFRATEEDTRR
jgi:hypothetical protein